MVNENLIDKLIDRTGWDNHMWETGKDYDLNNDKERSEFYSIYDTLSLEDVLDTKRDTCGLSKSEVALEEFIKEFDNSAYNLHKEIVYYPEDYIQFLDEHGEQLNWTIFLNEIQNHNYYFDEDGYFCLHELSDEQKRIRIDNYPGLVDYLTDENRLSVIFDEMDRDKEWEEDAWDFELNNIMNYDPAGQDYY